MPLTERPNAEVMNFLNGTTDKQDVDKKKETKKKPYRGEKSYLLWLPADQMAEVKAVSARLGMSMKEFFVNAIMKECQRYRK